MSTNSRRMIFRTFEKKISKKYHWGKFLNLLLMINFAIIIGIYFIALFPRLFRYKDQLLQGNFTFIISFIVLFLLRVMYYIFFKTKPSKAIGTLQLSEDEILLNSTKYPIAEIESLRFVGNDVKGDFRGYISKGTNNEFFLKLKNGQEMSVSFEQTEVSKLRDAKILLTKYKDDQLLSAANFENILNNTNYY